MFNDAVWTSLGRCRGGMPFQLSSPSLLQSTLLCCFLSNMKAASCLCCCSAAVSLSAVLLATDTSPHET